MWIGIVKRMCFMLFTLLVASIIVFILLEITPGDVAKIILGQHATEEALAALRDKMGLNRSPAIRYLSWLNQMLHGNFGSSLYMTGVKIGPLVLRRAVNSSLLALASLVFFVPLSLWLGTIAAMKDDTWIGSLISISGLLALSIPSFITGIGLIFMFSLVFPILPASSNVPPGTTIFQNLERLVLPAVSVSLVMFGYVTRMTQSSMVSVLRSDYVRAAFLKGLPRKYVIYVHALKNGLLPSITVIGMNIGWLFGGLIVVESLFGYPGIGQLLVLGLQSRDIPLVEVIMLLIIALYMLANFLTDLVYSLLDPRINMRRQ